MDAEKKNRESTSSCVVIKLFVALIYLSSSEGFKLAQPGKNEVCIGKDVFFHKTMYVSRFISSVNTIPIRASSLFVFFIFLHKQNLDTNLFIQFFPFNVYVLYFNHFQH